MGLIERFRELDTGLKILVGVAFVVPALLVLVIITLVLLAVIGAFVMDVGDDSADEPPATSFDTSLTDTAVTDTHTAGDDRLGDHVEGESEIRSSWNSNGERHVGDRPTR